MKVGDKIWVFDYNRRVYPKDGGIGRRAIYSEHFIQRTIEAETSRSWIVCGNKYPKADPRGLYTDEEKADNIWENDNRRRIVLDVERCSGKVLREIDSLINPPLV